MQKPKADSRGKACAFRKPPAAATKFTVNQVVKQIEKRHAAEDHK